MACKIHDGLFIGDAESSQDSSFITLNKITYIINTSGRQLPNLYESHGIRYLTYPWLDTIDFQVFDDCGIVVMQIAAFIDEAVDNGEAVLVHSLNGTSRCSLCIVAYLMYKYWWGLEKSCEFLACKREDVRVNKGFLEQLKIVDLQLQAARKRVCDEVMNSTSLTKESIKIIQALTTSNISKKTLLPSPTQASQILTSQSSKTLSSLSLNTTISRITESKLYDWDPDIVLQYITLTDSNYDEVILINTFINSQSELETFPGVGDRCDHINEKLKWIDSDASSNSFLPSTSTLGSSSMNGLRTSLSASGKKEIGLDVNVKPKLERPPNSNYNSFQLDVGWIDRDRILKASGKAKTMSANSSLLRSILSTGFSSRKQQQLKATYHSPIKSDGRDSLSPTQRLSGIVRQYQDEYERGSPSFGQPASNSLPQSQSQQSLTSSLDNKQLSIQDPRLQQGRQVHGVRLSLDVNDTSPVVSRGKLRAGGGYRDSIVDAREKGTNDEVAAATSNASKQRSQQAIAEAFQYGNNGRPNNNNNLQNMLDNSIRRVGSPITRPRTPQPVSATVQPFGGSCGGKSSKNALPRRPTSAGGVSTNLEGLDMYRVGGSAGKKRGSKKKMSSSMSSEQLLNSNLNANLWGNSPPPRQNSNGNGDGNNSDESATAWGVTGINGLSQSQTSKLNSNRLARSKQLSKRGGSPSPAGIRAHLASSGVYINVNGAGAGSRGGGGSSGSGRSQKLPPSAKSVSGSNYNLSFMQQQQQKQQQQGRIRQQPKWSTLP